MKLKLANLILALLIAGTANACRDAVVLVHGNAGSPSDFDNTYDELRSRGYASSEIVRPNWGSKTCPACNNHSGWEETPVINAMVDALAVSCTGKIDVIGHSMGATLAAWQIVENGLRTEVDTFVGIAGAFRGLRTCGYYPWNVPASTCGYWGLSIGSPFLNALYGEPLGDRTYSMKSWTDQIVCATGTCLVNGKHSSQIQGETATYSFATGHFGLLTGTPSFQSDLIEN